MGEVTCNDMNTGTSRTKECSFQKCCDFDEKQCRMRFMEGCPSGKTFDTSLAGQNKIVDAVADCCIDIEPTPEPTPSPAPTPVPPTPAPTAYPAAVEVNCNTADPAPFQAAIAAANGSEEVRLGLACGVAMLVAVWGHLF